jgi:mannitol 2-dehydrogenase
VKIRILNAGHQFVANAGELLSIKTISGCMNNTLIKELFYKVHIEEVIPHVNSVPNVTPRQYVDFIAERFSNPAMVDTVRRVSFDGSARHPGFVLPIVRQCLSKNISIQGLALIEAIWARMCYGTREDESLIEANDPTWDKLVAVAKEAKKNPKCWIEQKIYDKNISTNSDFIVAFDQWLLMIWSDGLSATIKHYLKKV